MDVLRAEHVRESVAASALGSGRLVRSKRLFDLQARFERMVPLGSVTDDVARHAAAARDAAAALFNAHGLRMRP